MEADSPGDLRSPEDGVECLIDWNDRIAVEHLCQTGTSRIGRIEGRDPTVAEGASHGAVDTVRDSARKHSGTAINAVGVADGCGSESALIGDPCRCGCIQRRGDQSAV